MTYDKYNTFLCGSLTTIAVFLGTAILIHNCERKEPASTEETETVIVTDTVRKFIDTPVLRDSAVVRYVTVKVPVSDSSKPEDTLADATQDSVSVALPITQKTYRDSTYTAWVSGYQPSLDSIEIYQPVRTITNTIARTETKYRTKRWGLGIQAGVGATPMLSHPYVKFEPYVGIGISYNIFCW